MQCDDSEGCCFVISKPFRPPYNWVTYSYGPPQVCSPAVLGRDRCPRGLIHGNWKAIITITLASSLSFLRVYHCVCVWVWVCGVCDIGSLHTKTDPHTHQLENNTETRQMHAGSFITPQTKGKRRLAGSSWVCPAEDINSIIGLKVWVGERKIVPVVWADFFLNHSVMQIIVLINHLVDIIQYVKNKVRII